MFASLRKETGKIVKKNEERIVRKLDLSEYLRRFETFFARPKSVHMEGDTKLHHRFVEALAQRDFPEPPQMPELDDVLIRLKKEAVLALEEIYAFVTMIRYFNRLKTMTFQEPLSSWLHDIDVPETMNEIVKTFTDEGTINPAYDEELFGIEEALKRSKAQIKESLQGLTRSSKLQPYLVDTQIHMHDGEETLLVRGGFNHVLKATVVGRSSGGFFYVVPQTVSKLKEREAALLSAREELIYRYRKRFSETMRKAEPFLKFLNKAFDRFDHYQARVRFAKAYDYEFVLPSEGKAVVLKDFAHPALSDPVLLNITFDTSIMLVTGVNAGGKTMLLKSILSAVFLSKYLLPFRCDAGATRIGRFKHIEAIIDDPQSVKNDISTFAGRMKEFAELFKKRDAIVGVDEIELGTDSDEAASLFRVLLEELRKRDIRFVVTTHHKRLASLMASDADVELVAALYDEERRMPTYTFLQGIIGKSYAFETALRYGIPAPIVEAAKKVYGEDKERLNELIERSTELEREMREKIRLSEEKLAEAERKKRAVEEEEEKLKEQYRKTLATLENRYNAAIKRAQEALKAKESKEGRRLLNKAHQFKSQKPQPPERKSYETLKEGDRIKYRSHRGVLISLRGEQATIEVDGLKMRVPLKELRPLDERVVAKTKKPKSRTTGIHVERGGASVSLKLLGVYADEAIEKIDKFLSDALLNGLDEVQIVHGTGTGVLARVVSDYLKTHPKIKRFYRMKGNQGVTIVEL
jgi:DNA mismatch repair protein MutS2